MSINIEGYVFEGPYRSTEKLVHLGGVYVILDNAGGTYYYIDCGESEDVKSRVEDHDRKDCWQKSAGGTLEVAVLYTTTRVEAEKYIRSHVNFPCGKR